MSGRRTLPHECFLTERRLRSVRWKFPTARADTLDRIQNPAVTAASRAISRSPARSFWKYLGSSGIVARIFGANMMSANTIRDL